MEKLILMSVLAYTVILPTIAARRQASVRSVKAMLLLLVALNLVYVLVVAFYFTAHFVPEWMP